MDGWQAILLGIVQGLTEFLPVSSSAHLMIARELFGVQTEGFLDFTVTVHFATVMSTLVVFRKPIAALFRDLFRFRLNDGTDYLFKLCLSMIPVLVVGLFFKDEVEALFGDSLHTVAVCLLVTAALLVFSDFAGGRLPVRGNYRNGISWWQALLVGVGQACAVAPGLSRSGTTIATGLVCGVKREQMAQFSFLMVLVPIIGEQLLDVLKGFSAASPAAGVGTLALCCGFVAAFLSGLLACRLMVALVKRARLWWFSLYCALVALLLFFLA